MTIGMCNEVYELKYASNSYILRMNKVKDHLYGTHKHLPLFKKLQIKTPDIVIEDYSKTELPFCYQIQTKIEGKDLLLVFHELSSSELKAIAKEISLIYDKFNTLPDQNNRQNEESQLASVENRRKGIIERNKTSKVLDEEVLEILNGLIDDHKSYFQKVTSKLYFDDMNSKNVMIHNGQFNGLVDLDFLSTGDYLDGIGSNYRSLVWQ